MKASLRRCEDCLGSVGTSVKSRENEWRRKFLGWKAGRRLNSLVPFPGLYNLLEGYRLGNATERARGERSVFSGRHVVANSSRISEGISSKPVTTVLRLTRAVIGCNRAQPLLYHLVGSPLLLTGKRSLGNWTAHIENWFVNGPVFFLLPPQASDN